MTRLTPPSLPSFAPTSLSLWPVGLQRYRARPFYDHQTQDSVSVCSFPTEMTPESAIGSLAPAEDLATISLLLLHHTTTHGYQNGDENHHSCGESLVLMEDDSPVSNAPRRPRCSYFTRVYTTKMFPPIGRLGVSR